MPIFIQQCAKAIFVGGTSIQGCLKLFYRSRCNDVSSDHIAEDQLDVVHRVVVQPTGGGDGGDVSIAIQVVLTNSMDDIQVREGLAVSFDGAAPGFRVYLR